MSTATKMEDAVEQLIAERFGMSIEGLRSANELRCWRAEVRCATIYELIGDNYRLQCEITDQDLHDLAPIVESPERRAARKRRLRAGLYIPFVRAEHLERYH